MKSSILSISTILLISTALVGCGANNQAQNENSRLEQIGLYTDNKNANGNTGAFRYINDRGFNDQYMLNQVDATNAGESLGDGKGAYSQRGIYRSNDYNYHGHLNTTYNGVPTRSYNTGHDNIWAQKITDRLEHLENVNDVAAIIDGDTIFVAIDTDEDYQKVEKEVRRIVEGMANGRNVTVVTDKGMFNRVRNRNIQR